MYATETPLRAIVEALDEPSEFHGRDARIAYSTLRQAGFDQDVAGYQTAKALHDKLNAAHSALARTMPPTGNTSLHAVFASAHNRRVITLRDLKNLVELWAPIREAA